MDKNQLIQDLLDREWIMFQNVRNKGGKACCQEDERTFRIMRRAQFEAWNERMLACYQEDLTEAQEAGRNVLTEKYGYMMQWTYPAEYAGIQSLLPPVSAEKMGLIEEIVEIEVRQTRKFRDMYPNLGKCGRPLTAAENGEGTSVETYTRGELMTYSETTLREYLLHLQKLDRSKILFPMIVIKAMTRACGYITLNDAEKACR